MPRVLGVDFLTDWGRRRYSHIGLDCFCGFLRFGGNAALHSVLCPGGPQIPHRWWLFLSFLALIRVFPRSISRHLISEGHCCDFTPIWAAHLRVQKATVSEISFQQGGILNFLLSEHLGFRWAIASKELGDLLSVGEIFRAIPGTFALRWSGGCRKEQAKDEAL
jgi:hypothetical protein